jgi:hypothetical protein
MQAHTRISPSYLLHFLISAFFIFAVTSIGELGEGAFTAHAFSDTAPASPERDAQPANRLTANYRWNLNNEDLPMISLPEHIADGLDLSLTFPLDNFEFPLFQSLNFNQRARKYSLMVMVKDEVGPVTTTYAKDRRTYFVELLAGGRDRQFSATGKFNLHLTDRGEFKLLTSGNGTVYTFAAVADGELRCSRIADADGVALDFRYALDASLKTISDNAGRTMTFGYTNQSVTSITQTWGSRRTLRQTWAVAEQVRFAHAPAAPIANGAAATALFAKHIPSNAVSPRYTSEMATSDSMLATIFGGPGAIAAANGFEPTSLNGQYPLYRGDLIGDDGRLLRGHLSFAMHLYGSADATGETEIYVPAGFVSHSDEPSPTDAVVLFYYPRLGNLTDVTLAVFHVKNFQLTNEGERVRIGNIGGRGGSAGSYRHSHLEFYRGHTALPPLSVRVGLRIDPATIFTSMRRPSRLDAGTARPLDMR